MTHFRQRKSDAPPDPAASGLVGLGFRERDARHALEVIRARHPAPPPIEDILREALTLLTP